MTLGYATVRINITALIIDGPDANDIPDDQALTAILTLDPMVTQGSTLQYNDAGTLKLKALTQFQVGIGETGDIDHYGRDYVKVPAPSAVDSNIDELQWRASFSDIKYGPLRISKIDPIFFYVHPGEDINLAEHINVAPSSTAVLITRGPRGYGVTGAGLTADGELVFEWDSETGPVASDPILLPAAISPAHFVQSTPAATWTVNHNLNRYPAGVSVMLPTGELIDPDIVHSSITQTVITFPTPTAGRVELI